MGRRGEASRHDAPPIFPHVSGCRARVHLLAVLKKHPDTARMYFTHSGGVYQIDPASSARGAYILQPREQGRLKKLLDGVQDDAGLSEFIGRLLTLDPDHRCAHSQPCGRSTWCGRFGGGGGVLTPPSLSVECGKWGVYRRESIVRRKAGEESDGGRTGDTRLPARHHA